jgi:hypothetical protein
MGWAIGAAHGIAIRIPAVGFISDVHDEYFSGPVPAQRQRVLNSPTDQQSLPVFIFEP